MQSLFRNKSGQKKNETEKSNHVVHMTEYFVGNFGDSNRPDYVSTFNISSCVIILVKNIDPELKKTTHIGMAHVNLSNLYQRKENLNSFLQAFEDQGGQLKAASIQLMGGVIHDPNSVRIKIKTALKTLLDAKGLNALEIKEPGGYELDISIEKDRLGIGEKMDLICDDSGTYLRVWTFENYVPNLEKTKFNTSTAKTIFSNVDKILAKDLTEYQMKAEQAKAKAVNFNNLLSQGNDTQDVINKLRDYSRLDRSEFQNASSLTITMKK